MTSPKTAQRTPPYDSIANPDVTAWSCPHCKLETYHVYGFDCEECGFSLDRDLVREALRERAALKVLED
jgi:ribosomal protein L37E